MRKVRPLGQVTTRKSSMPAVSYSSVRDLSDQELRNLRPPRRKISEPLAPSTILLGRQMTSLNSGLSPSQSPASEPRYDNRLSPISRRPTLLSRRRTSDPAVLSVPRPPPTTSPFHREPSPLMEARCSPRPISSLSPSPPSPPPVTVCAEVQAEVKPDPGLVQRWRTLDEEIVVLLSNQKELENNVRNCGLQGEEYKRLYEAELVAHERSRATQKEVEDSLKEMASRRQRLLMEHEATVSATRREFTIRTDGVRREHSQTLNSYSKKLLTLGACLPTKTTAVNERQSQLALLLKDKQTLLDEIDNLRERVGRIKVGEEEEEEEEEDAERQKAPCEFCESKAQELDRLKEECLRREERIAELQEKIRIVEGNGMPSKGGAARFHSARSSVGQRRT